MQAAVTPENGDFYPSAAHRILFDRFWDDVAPLNNYSPEAARALLSREARVPVSDAAALSDPWVAVRAALTERVAGRRITRSA